MHFYIDISYRLTSIMHQKEKSRERISIIDNLKSNLILPYLSLTLSLSFKKSKHLILFRTMSPLFVLTVDGYYIDGRY